MLIRDTICSLALCMSMISTIHANGIPMVLQKEFIEQEQNNVPPIIKEEVASRQLSEEEQKIVQALTIEARDAIAEYKRNIQRGVLSADPLLLEIPEGISEADMTKVITDEMGISAIYITEKALSSCDNYRIFFRFVRSAIAAHRKEGHGVALVVNGVDQFEHYGKENQYLCDLRYLLRENHIFLLFTARNIAAVDPLIQCRFNRDYKMEPMNDYWERFNLIDLLLRYEVEKELIGESIVPFIAEQTEGFTAYDLDTITTLMRMVTNRNTKGLMPQDRVFGIISAHRNKINRHKQELEYAQAPFYKKHPVITGIVASAIAVVTGKLGLNFINKYRHTPINDKK